MRYCILAYNIERFTSLDFVTIYIKWSPCVPYYSIFISIPYRSIDSPSTIIFSYIEWCSRSFTELVLCCGIHRLLIKSWIVINSWVSRINPVITWIRLHKNDCGHFSGSIPKRWCFSPNFLRQKKVSIFYWILNCEFCTGIYDFNNFRIGNDGYRSS